jgi:hypothetical protein
MSTETEFECDIPERLPAGTYQCRVTHAKLTGSDKSGKMIRALSVKLDAVDHPDSAPFDFYLASNRADSAKWWAMLVGGEFTGRSIRIEGGSMEDAIASCVGTAWELDVTVNGSYTNIKDLRRL